ncbi:cytochrome P450 9e2-like [Coccinella septempunctata]|uniref:cytochrome P450 9e2-like n=1 Tax=Coccinella septempunctata TaxID=41139 RepID=UPI001D05FCAA|nr:cytochrome P450 9e2-like [Coccinella septempunctata]XP_044762893.1 cytochrome P450 9e2-like [Coccinella septempunctata]
MFWLVATLALILLFYYYDRNRFMYWARKDVKQVTPPPIFGDNWHLMFKKMAFCDYIKKTYDSFDSVRYFGHYQFYQPLLVVKDPKLLKQICVKDFEHFLDHRPFTTEEADPLWNKNLFSLKGQKWKEMRSTLSPFFTGSKMRQMFVLMHECARNFADYLADKQEDMIEMELKDAFTRYSNDIIASTAFGVQCDSLRDGENQFYINGKRATDFSGFVKNLKFVLHAVLPKLSKLLKATFFDKEISDFFRGVVRDSLEYRESNKIDRPDLINLLLQARRDPPEEEVKLEETNFAAVKEHMDIKSSRTRGKLDMSLDDITSQALIFFFAGFETVSTVMCFVAYELAVNHDVQLRLREELDEFRNSGRKFSYEGLAKLPYLDMVLSETLRKWPPTPATDRQCNKTYTIDPELDGEKPLRIDAGDIIMIPIWGLHRDPKHWDNPDRFDPERFSAENRHKVDPYVYVPFGVGPRNCIGSRYAITEVKVVFFELLARFEILPVGKSCIPFVADYKTFNLTSSNGFWFGLKKRDV